MPARLVINPIVIVDGVRKPKVATLTDPGRALVPRLDGNGDPIFEDGDPVLDPQNIPLATAPVGSQPVFYDHSTAISDGVAGQRNDVCLSLVSGVDLSNVDKDAEAEDLFELSDVVVSELKVRLNKTPAELSQSRGTVTKLKTRIKSASIDETGLDENSELYWWANRVAQEFTSGFDVRGMGLPDL